jgi:cell division protein FtsI (penicillin-binding protein 3)
VIEKSSNIGTVKVALLLEEENLYKYIRRFGFGQPTGIDLPGEVGGLLQPPSRWSSFTISSIPMGQEIGVTAIQMASALSVIANGGIQVRPMVVKEIQDERGEVIKSFPTFSHKRVIAQETAQRMRQLLRGVVEKGTGKAARLKRYTAGGKTGTAQKLEADGTYSHAKFVASFIGFAPAEDPEIVVCVFVDEPKPVYYGGSVAAPIFKEITTSALKYLALGESEIVKR